MRLFRKYAINANNKQTFKINNHMVDSDNTLVVLLRIIITFNPSVGTFYRIMNALGLGLKLNFYVIKKATKINSPPLKYVSKENLRKQMPYAKVTDFPATFCRT